MRRSPAFVKLTQWEHWPTFLFYAPLLPFFILRSLRAGHPVFFAIANPGILFSGSGTESKFKSLQLLPQEFVPKSLLLKKNDHDSGIEEHLRNHNLHFPLIAKPDIGFRGYLVKKVDSLKALENYLNHVNEDVIIQEFIPYEKELGIFYHRIPGQKKGKISSVTIKKFRRVKGDGKRTLNELIREDDRAFLYTDLLDILHRPNLHKILAKDEELTLSVIGNHSKGTQFLNGNHLIDKEFEDFIDGICSKVNGWYYGRLDIKFENFEKMLIGKDFKILEINGIISEPTHIYDATDKQASYFKALKSINDHWNIMAEIARKLHKEKSIPYPAILPYFKNMWWLRTHTQKLKKLNTEDF